MKNILAPLMCLFTFVAAQCQQAKESLPPNYIKTIQFYGDSIRGKGNPILKLGERLHLSFDDIIGDEANYYYQISHYNYNWTPSQLVQNEYLEGFDNVRILNYKNSTNTFQSYSHYELTIPNQDTKALKVSGNYLIEIFNENKELVFSRKFMIYEALSGVGISLKRSRDINYINEKQVVNFTIHPKEISLKNPKENVSVLILQNQNLKTAIAGLQPQYTLGEQLIYRYDQQTAFWGGNEYLQFDNKDLRSTTADINFIEVEDLYHHYLFPDKTRAGEPYTYNPDINGDFVIRALQGTKTNPSTEAEYTWVHFKLENYAPLKEGELHLYGNFNNFEITAETALRFNKETGFYETALLLKQGFYNYKYVLRKPNGVLEDGFVSGNHEETENSYQVLVYYHAPGARYHRIIGYGVGNSKNISN